jgi:predicted DNA repair protein MutK
MKKFKRDFTAIFAKVPDTSTPCTKQNKHSNILENVGMFMKKLSKFAPKLNRVLSCITFKNPFWIGIKIAISPP